MVIFFVQSDSQEDVTDAINIFTNTNITIEYDGQTYVANNKTSQFINPTSESGDDDGHKRKLIISLTVIGGLFILMSAFLLTFIGYRRYKKANSGVWRIHVAASNSLHDNTKKYEIQELYLQGASQCFVQENEFTVRPSIVNLNNKAEMEYYNEGY